MAYVAGTKSSIYGSSVSYQTVTPAGVLYTDRRNFYLDPNKTAELYKSVTPFTTILSKMPRKYTKDPDYKMFEHEGSFLNQMFFIAGTGSWSNGTIANLAVEKTVAGDDNVGFLAKGLKIDVYNSAMSTRKAQFVIDTVDSQQIIDVVSMDASPTALADGDVAVVVGHSAGEGTKVPEAFADELSVRWNSAGILKTPVKISGTLLAMTEMRGYSRELERLRSEMYKVHKIKEAKNAYFSRRVDGTSTPSNHPADSDGNVIRSSHGIIPILEGESQDKSITMADYDWDAFVDHMIEFFEYDNDKGVKWLLGGDAVVAFFSKIGSSGFVNGNTFNMNLTMSKPETVLGLNVQSMITPFGVLRLMRDRLFSQGFVKSTTKPFTGYGLIIDPTNVSQVQFRAPKYQTGLATNDYGGEVVIDQWFSDWGIGLTLPKYHWLTKFV